jgi:Secretion system C-terminal sorting domain
MKKLLTLIFCVATIPSFCQIWGTGSSGAITFDSGDVFYQSLVKIDTVNFHHNIWQIGKPNKTVFTSAYSLPNAIVTDTLNPYPVNDTSVFIAKIPGRDHAFPLQFIDFWYRLDIDSGAIAKVELSEDHGVHWINTIDSLPVVYSWGSIPDFKHSTVGWKRLGLWRDWTPCPDTIYFRFTFISDSVFANKDGWMIDNFSVGYWWEGYVPQILNNNLITIYPNPSKGNIYIHSNKQNAGSGSLSVYDMKGREVGKTKQLPANGYLNLPLPDGVYILKYFEGDEYCVKRIVIDR